MSGIILEKLLIMMIMGLIGFVCGKAGLIDGDTNKRLSNLSLLVVNPLLIFVSYQMPYSGDIALNLGIVFLFSVFAFVRHCFLCVERTIPMWEWSGCPLPFPITAILESPWYKGCLVQKALFT